MAEQQMKWGIYIDYGTEKEFEVSRNAKFPTKKMAIDWCKNNNMGYQYPQKCVMRIEEILKRKPYYYNE